MLRSAMGYLAAADATAMAAETQAQCLLALEQLDAIETAARASILAAFTSGQGYSADADYSSRAWMINKTRVTKGAASGHLGWVRRAAAHPQVVAALAEGHILSESVARKICQWTDKLPEDWLLAADAILIVAAKAGADLRGLAELAAEIYARSRSHSPPAQVGVLPGAGRRPGRSTPGRSAPPTPWRAGVDPDGRGHGLHRWSAFPLSPSVGAGGLSVVFRGSTSVPISSRAAAHRPGGKP
jgi:hypothetical protein